MKISTITSQFKPLDKEKEKELFKEYYETPSTRRKKEIKDMIILAQSRNIISLAQMYRDKDDIEDLFQQGMVALLEIFPNYDHTQEASFFTYAKRGIIRQMAKYLRRNKVMRISEAAVDKLRKINKAKEMLARLNKPVTTTEISNITGIKEKEVISVLNAISTTTTLNELSLETDDEVINTIEDTNAEQQFEDVLNRECFNARHIGGIDLSILSPSETETLKLMYVDNKTTEEIAEELNTSPKIVTQFKYLALKKIKEALNDN